MQPIELQNMYSQLSNVSRASANQQAAQLSQSIQLQQDTIKAQEASARVQQATNDKSTSPNVNADGRGSSSAFSQDRKGGEPPEDASGTDDVSSGFRKAPDTPAYLGTIIDITR